MAMIEKLVMFAIFMLVLSAIVWFMMRPDGESHD